MLPEEVEKVTKATVAAPTKPVPKFKSRSMAVGSSDEEDHPQPGETEGSMYADHEPTEVKPKKPRKKVEKKPVPMGKNGLKKKRIVKSRMSTDAKGYMGKASSKDGSGPGLNLLFPVTEDYSSYESVDEEEPEEPEKPKKKLSSKASESKLKRNTSSKDTKVPSKETKKRASTGGVSSSKSTTKQGSLMTFFKK